MVEFKTRYDAKTLGKLTEVQLKNSGRLTKGFVWIFIIMGVIMLLFAYDEYTSGESYYFSLGFSIFSILLWGRLDFNISINSSWVPDTKSVLFNT